MHNALNPVHVVRYVLIIYQDHKEKNEQMWWNSASHLCVFEGPWSLWSHYLQWSMESMQYGRLQSRTGVTCTCSCCCSLSDQWFKIHFLTAQPHYSILMKPSPALPRWQINSHPIGCILWNSFVESHYVHVCNTPRHASQTTHHIQREKNIRSFIGQIQSVPLQMRFCQKNTCIYVNVNAQELLIYRMDTWIFS